MNFSSHSRAGLTISAIIFCGALIVTSEFDRPLIWGLAVYIGAIFPDLDTDSIPSRWTARAGFIFAVIMLVLKKPWPPAILGAGFFLIKSGKHRGFIHKWWFPIAFIAAGCIWNQLLCFAFGAGLIVHFAVDKISPFSLENWR